MEVCVGAPGDTTRCPIQAEHQRQCRCEFICRVSSLAVASVVVSLDSSGARSWSTSSLVRHTSQLKLWVCQTTPSRGTKWYDRQDCQC